MDIKDLEQYPPMRQEAIRDNALLAQSQKKSFDATIDNIAATLSISKAEAERLAYDLDQNNPLAPKTEELLKINNNLAFDIIRNQSRNTRPMPVGTNTIKYGFLPNAAEEYLEQTKKYVEIHATDLFYRSKAHGNQNLAILELIAQGELSAFLHRFFTAAEKNANLDAKVEFTLESLVEGIVNHENICLHEYYDHTAPIHMRGLLKIQCPSTFKDTDALTKFIISHYFLA